MQAIFRDNKNMPTQSDKCFVAVKSTFSDNQTSDCHYFLGGPSCVTLHPPLLSTVMNPPSPLSHICERKGNFELLTLTALLKCLSWLSGGLSIQLFVSGKKTFYLL